MCVCDAVQFVNELLSINMPHTKINETMCVCVVLKTHAVKGLQERKESVHISFEKPVPTSESVYTSEPAPTNKQGKVCMHRSKNRVYTSNPALTNKQGKVCMPCSKSLCRRANRGSVYNTSINMNTLNRIPKQTRQCVYASF